LKKLEAKEYITTKLTVIPAKRHIYIKDKINEFRIKESSVKYKKNINSYEGIDINGPTY
jgi:hypothetical protein